VNRICIVRHNYYPDEAHVRRDAEALVEHGYEVDIVCLRKKGQKRRESVRDVNIYRLPVEHHRRGIFRYLLEYSAFFGMVSLTLTWLSLKRRYRVVEVVSMPEILIFSTLLPKLLGAKIVMNVFDHTPETYAKIYKLAPDNIAIRLMRGVSKLCLRLSDHVITAEQIGQEIALSRGIPNSKVSVVLNVPDESVFHYPSTSSKKVDGFCLITHGSLTKHYGVQTLIKAVPLLRDSIPDLKVMIVGDGEYRSQLEEMVQSLDVGRHVVFTGLVPFEEVPSLISNADIGVVSALIPLLPNKLFEYLALGKPVVVAANSAVRVLFDDNSVKFYQPENEQDLAQCILELYRNPEIMANLTARGSAIYDRYRWSNMKLRYLEVFDELCQPNRAKKPVTWLSANKADMKKNSK
jgi:glycosyltransferase involved in cell wall biosynthesis